MDCIENAASAAKIANMAVVADIFFTAEIQRMRRKTEYTMPNLKCCRCGCRQNVCCCKLWHHNKDCWEANGQKAVPTPKYLLVKVHEFRLAQIFCIWLNTWTKYK
jgi:hypothetical protein